MPTDLPKIELKPIDWLKPYEKNAKKHPPEQIERLAKVLKKGWDQPIVAWIDGTIIKGHGRRLASIHNGWTEVPVIVRYDLTPAEADAARIADNAVSSTQYDSALMRDELSRLMADAESFDIDSLGLTGKELEFLTESLDETNLDAVMTDTTAAIEEQKTEDQERVEKADAELVALGAAFGFKKVRAGDQRVITSFQAEAEEATGKTGYDAFIEGLRMAVARGFV